MFDGPEDRNGTRNHDEIRFWSDNVTPGAGGYIYDDQGRAALKKGERIVIASDMNVDRVDGDSTQNAIHQLTDNPLINHTRARSCSGRCAPTRSSRPSACSTRAAARRQRLPVVGTSLVAVDVDVPGRRGHRLRSTPDAHASLCA